MSDTTKTVGHVTATLSEAYWTAIGDVLDLALAELGDRIGDLTLVEADPSSMPWAAPGIRAVGHWSDNARRIRLSRALIVPSQLAAHPGRPRNVAGHELMHVLSDDWLRRWQRRRIRDYITPEPDGWGDLTIGDQPPAYAASPEECFASYGAAAVLGVGVAFPTFYRRRIAPADWPAVAAIALARSRITLDS